jgi:hypothetical protein
MTTLATLGRTLDEYLAEHLSSQVKKCIVESLMRGITGQVLLNLNRGEIQSFEVKEHYRVTHG